MTSQHFCSIGKKIGLNYFGQIFESEKKEIEDFFKFSTKFNSSAF